MMLKSSVFVVLIAGLVLMPSAGFSAERLDWGGQLHSGPSACPIGPVVVNVVQKVLNSVDSGTGGYWAFDDYIRQIQVVQTGPSSFCATVQYQGSFTTAAGTSPGSSGAVGAGVVGTFQGGYVSTIFTGTLKTGVRTKGSIGTFDYQCDISGNCPGAVSWPTLFFNGIVGFDIGGWWGWVYHAGNNGSWVNASTGNSGDITGN